MMRQFAYKMPKKCVKILVTSSQSEVIFSGVLFCLTNNLKPKDIQFTITGDNDFVQTAGKSDLFLKPEDGLSL